MLPDDESEAWKGAHAWDAMTFFYHYGPDGRLYFDNMSGVPKRKRPAELDDKDRKNPWGHIPFHN